MDEEDVANLLHTLAACEMTVPWVENIFHVGRITRMIG